MAQYLEMYSAHLHVDILLVFSRVEIVTILQTAGPGAKYFDWIRLYVSIPYFLFYLILWRPFSSILSMGSEECEKYNPYSLLLSGNMLIF